jgi:hypothetical protein
MPSLGRTEVNFPRHGGRGVTVNLGTKKLCFWGIIRVKFYSYFYLTLFDFT